jgi:hypothetical protein
MREKITLVRRDDYVRVDPQDPREAECVERQVAASCLPFIIDPASERNYPGPGVQRTEVPEHRDLVAIRKRVDLPTYDPLDGTAPVGAQGSASGNAEKETARLGHGKTSGRKRLPG